MRIEDKLTPEELQELYATRRVDGKNAKLTQNQHTSFTLAQELIHEVLKDLDAPLIIAALHAHFAARPGMGAAELEWLGNQFCRMAWEKDRIK